MYTIYGIKNCSTMKKAFDWLDEKKIDYQFHNYKTDGLTAELAASLIALVGWQNMLNTKGMTWRKLDESVKSTITTAQSAQQLMLDNPSIIKRPLLVKGNKMLLGFSSASYQQFFIENH